MTRTSIYAGGDINEHKDLPANATLVTHVPCDIPRPDFSSLAEKVDTDFVYYQRNGSRAFYDVLVYLASGQRTFACVTLWRHADGIYAWYRIWPGVQRPLYNLPDIISRKGDPVVISPHSLTADNFAVECPEYVSTTWLGTNKVISKTNLCPLHGRLITILDGPSGFDDKTALEIRRTLLSYGIRDVWYLTPAAILKKLGRELDPNWARKKPRAMQPTLSTGRTEADARQTKALTAERRTTSPAVLTANRDAPSTTALAQVMRAMSKTHYGHAGPEFMTYILQDIDRHVSRANDIVQAFVETVYEDEDDAQVERVATTFGLIKAAGHLAVEAGILPWSPHSVDQAVTTCFHAWRDHRGGGESEERRSARKHLAGFFEAHGASRFEELSFDPNEDEENALARRDEFPVRDRCGYKVKEDDGSYLYYVLPNAWEREVCDDHDHKLMETIAAEAGALWLGEHGRKRRQKRLPDYSKPIRVVAIRPHLL